MSCMNASDRCVFFLRTIRAVCYRMIDWKKGLELALYYLALKRLECFRTFGTVTLFDCWQDTAKVADRFREFQ